MDSYRSVAAIVTEPVVNVLHSCRVSADTLSMASLGCAALSGIAYFFAGGNSLALALALFFLLLNGLLDGLDGALARKTGTASKYGDFLDHVIDRYADVFIISGIFLGGFLRADLGALVITGVLLASYLGTQAQAVGVGRIYGGIMGRADRMIVLALATCVNLVYPVALGPGGFEFPILGWALLLIGVLSHVTALQRIWQTRKTLLDGRQK
jgi:phosphatidylglycerophosphate synthase